MDIRIEDKEPINILKVGDIVAGRNNTVYLITEQNKSYGLMRLDRYDDVEFWAGNLEELTAQIKEVGYKIYNQKDYELVIRRKE